MFYVGIWILAVLAHHIWLQELRAKTEKRAHIGVVAYAWPSKATFAHYCFASFITLAVFLLRVP